MRFEHVYLRNNTDKSFETKWDGEPYEIKANETKPFVAFVADNFVKHAEKEWILAGKPEGKFKELEVISEEDLLAEKQAEMEKKMAEAVKPKAETKKKAAPKKKASK